MNILLGQNENLVKSGKSKSGVSELKFPVHNKLKRTILLVT
jgi:hypothetical protein